MNWLFPSGVTLSGIASAPAFLLAHKRPEHRPVAFLLAYGFFSDILRWFLRDLVLVPARAELGTAPYVGTARIAFHIDAALFLAYPLGVTALAILVFARRRPWWLAAIWILLVAITITFYPTLRAQNLRRLYLGVECAAIAILLGTFLRWIARHPTPTLTHGCVMLIGGIELGMLLGPYRFDIFSNWDMAAAMYSTLYIALAIVQAGARWSSSGSNSPSP